MKTVSVSGEVVSSKTLSVSKAARILSKFVSLDNGASPAFAAYLRHASGSFDELTRLLKECKSLGGQQRVKKQYDDGVVIEGTVGSIINGGETDLLAKEMNTIKRKEYRGMNRSKGETGRIEVDSNVVQDEGSAMRVELQKVEGMVDGNVADLGGARKKLKKRRANNEILENDSDERRKDKKKKKKN